MVAEQTEKDIDETRSQYIPVAVRTRILFFCTYDLVSCSPLAVVVFRIHPHTSHNLSTRIRLSTIGLPISCNSVVI